LSIRTETLKSLLMDVVDALYRQGLRNFVVLSGHAGGTHNAVLIDAGECLLSRLPEAKIAVVTEYDLAAEEGKGLIETVGDSHAGEIEASRILATRPHLLKEGAVEAYPAFPKHILVRNKQAYWPSAVWGDPSKASAEKGRKIEEVVVDALERLVVELEEFVEPAGC
jgi:creatinine amidohydrolase